MRVEPDQHDLVDLARVDPCVLQGLTGRADRALQQIFDELLELRARQLHRQMFRPARIGGDEGQVDVGFQHRRQLHLRLLRGLLEPLQRHAVFREVDAVALLELRRDPVDDLLIEVVAAEVRVAVGRLDLEHAIADLEHRDVERASTEVIDRDRFRTCFLVEPVGERCRRRLVDDPQHFETRDTAGVLGRLTLGVVEVGRNRYDGLRHRLAEIGLRGLLHLLQHESRDLRGRVLLALRLHPRVAIRTFDDLERHQLGIALDEFVLEPPADQPLDREKCVRRIGHRLPLRR